MTICSQDDKKIISILYIILLDDVDDKPNDDIVYQILFHTQTSSWKEENSILWDDGQFVPELFRPVFTLLCPTESVDTL